jgi:TPR repeat protein
VNECKPLFRGNGVEQNLKQAVALFRRAAEEGAGTPRAKVTALDKLGECYSKGLGVKQEGAYTRPLLSST